MKLHYQSLGEGQPLVIVHGLFGSSDNWRSMAKFFSKFYRVISVDLRNHGRSPHAERQDFPAMAGDLYELCESLGLTKINLLGHSLGGKVVMQFASEHPLLVKKMVVVDISHRRYWSEHTPMTDAMMALDLSQFDSRSSVDEALAEKIPDKTVRQFLLMNLVSTNGKLNWRINLPALKQNYPQMMAAICEQSEFHIPTLFVYGEHSDYVTEQDRQMIKRQFSQAQFAPIPAGHWVHAERPQQFKQVVEEFLNHD